MWRWIRNTRYPAHLLVWSYWGQTLYWPLGGARLLSTLRYSYHYFYRYLLLVLLFVDVSDSISSCTSVISQLSDSLSGWHFFSGATSVYTISLASTFPTCIWILFSELFLPDLWRAAPHNGKGWTEETEQRHHHCRCKTCHLSFDKTFIFSFHPC